LLTKRKKRSSNASQRCGQGPQLRILARPERKKMRKEGGERATNTQRQKEPNMNATMKREEIIIENEAIGSPQGKKCPKG